MEAPFRSTTACDCSLMFGAPLPPERQMVPAQTLFFIMLSLVTIRPAIVAKVSHNTCEEIQIFRGVRDTRVLPGKLFFYPISPFAFRGTITLYKVTLANGSVLPKWLEYNPNTSTLQGLPMLEESGDYHLTVSAHGAACAPNTPAATASFALHVHSSISICKKQISINQKPVNDIIYSEGQCAQDISITFAEIIIYHPAGSLTIQERLSLIYAMAEYLHLDPFFLTLIPFKESFNKHLQNLTVRSEDIKYISTVENHYVELCWPVGFGGFAMLNELVQVLRHNVQSSQLSQLLGYEIAGWRILQKGNSEKRNVEKRHRRQLITTPRPTMRPTKLMKPTKTEVFTFWTTTLLHPKSIIRPSTTSSSLYKDSGTTIPSYTDVFPHSVTNQRDLGTLHVLSVHSGPPAFTVFQSLPSADNSLSLSPSLTTASLTEFERQDDLSSRTPSIAEFLQSPIQQHSTFKKSKPTFYFTQYHLSFFVPVSKTQSLSPVQSTVDVSISSEDALCEKMPVAHFPKEFITNSAGSSPNAYLTAPGLAYEDTHFTTNLSVLIIMSTPAKLRFPFSSVATSLFFSGCSHQKQDLFNNGRYASESLMSSPQMKEQLFTDENSPIFTSVLNEISKWAVDLNLVDVMPTADLAMTSSASIHILRLAPDSSPITQLYYSDNTPALTTYSTEESSVSLLTSSVEFGLLPRISSIVTELPSLPLSTSQEMTGSFGFNKTSPVEELLSSSRHLSQKVFQTSEPFMIPPQTNGLLFIEDTIPITELHYSDNTPALTAYSTEEFSVSLFTSSVEFGLLPKISSIVTELPSLTLSASKELPGSFAFNKTSQMEELLSSSRYISQKVFQTPEPFMILPQTNGLLFIVDTTPITQLLYSDNSPALTAYSTEEFSISLFTSSVEFGLLPRTSSIVTELPSLPLLASKELISSFDFNKTSPVEEFLSSSRHIGQKVFQTSESFMIPPQTNGLLFVEDTSPITQLYYSDNTPALTVYSTEEFSVSLFTSSVEFGLLPRTSSIVTELPSLPLSSLQELKGSFDFNKTSPVEEFLSSSRHLSQKVFQTSEPFMTLPQTNELLFVEDTSRITQLYYSDDGPALTAYSTEEFSVSVFISSVEFGLQPRTNSIITELPSLPLSASEELTGSFAFHKTSQVEELLSSSRHISQKVFQTSEPFMILPQTNPLLFTKDKASMLTKLHNETPVWNEPSHLIYITASGVVVISSQFLSVDSLFQGSSQTHYYDTLLLSLPIQSTGSSKLHFTKNYFSSYASDVIRISVMCPDILQLETSDLILAGPLGTKADFHTTRKYTSQKLKDSSVTSLQAATSVFPWVQGTSIFPFTPPEESSCDTGTKQTPWLPTSQVIPTGQTNTSPRVVNSINWIMATIGHKFSFSVPADTFYDQEDGDTPQLTLGMNPADGSPMSSGNWLHFDSQFQTMHGYPLTNDFQYSPQEFLLFATDSEGLRTSETLTIELLRPTAVPCHSYTIRTKNSYHSFLRDRGRVYLFFEKLSKYLSSASSHNITVLRLSPGSTLIAWYDHSFCIKNNRCAIDEIQKVLVKLRLPSGNAHPDFVEAMLPEYNIYHSEDVVYGGTCSSNESSTPNRTAVVFNSCHPWTRNIFFTLLISTCAAIIIILMTFWYCKYNKKIIGSHPTSFHGRPVLSYADLEMDMLKSRKSAVVEQEVAWPADLWLPVPTQSQQHLCRPNANLGVSRLPPPPKYRLPPLY